MAFVELEDGSWINPDLVESIFKANQSDTSWKVGLNHGEAATITDADRAQILKTAGFVKIKKEKDDEQ
ncbi:hypothetical protein FAM4067_00309 [Lacticaseibacillus paracasei]|uniref:hypothetical protein n=1 Tax=Lacticaseibacillus paracasei TaxID=1597 RepID=UPI000FF27FA8|nr:hypothetical protein [Lacticaseibacillus paracasei]RNE23238.1 hypothetical protein FAM4067_00309 [Lacticaseibacillus paracasei]